MALDSVSTIRGLCLLTRTVLISRVRLKRGRDGLELGERGGQVVHDLARNHLRRLQVVEVLERFVAQPGDVEVRLVASHEFVVPESAVPLRLNPLGSRSESVSEMACARMASQVAMSDSVIQRR